MTTSRNYRFINMPLSCAMLRRKPIETLLHTPHTFEIHNKAAWNSLNSSCLASDRYQHEIEAKCVGPSHRDQYPQDIVKPAGLKNEVNSMSNAKSTVHRGK